VRRRWSVSVRRLGDRGGVVTELHGVEVEWTQGEQGLRMREIPGTEFCLEVDLVILALGFLHVRHEGLVAQLGISLKERGHIQISPAGATSLPGVFAAGDATWGTSLVVRAIAGGREAARAIHEYLS